MGYGWYHLTKGIRERKYVPCRVARPIWDLVRLARPPVSKSTREASQAVANDPFPDSELAREKVWSRIHLIPLLQAEEDRDLVRRHLADQAREKELLGENIKVYNSDRYVSVLRGLSCRFHRFGMCIPVIPRASSNRRVCFFSDTYDRHMR